MAEAAQRCKALGKPIGTVGGTPEVVAQYRAMGFDFVAIASDLGLLMRGARLRCRRCARRRRDPCALAARRHAHRDFETAVPPMRP